jgi:hypothetical protein
MTRFPSALLLVSLAACSRAADRPAPDRLAADPHLPATIPVGDFQQLRYLAGSWRGDRDSGPPFFQRFVFLNDTTIRSFQYRQDSSFSTPAESTLIAWTGNRVRSGGPGGSWLATGWGPDSVRFEPEEGASNSFTWIRESQDAWTARLDLAAPGSTPVLYRMTRVPR